MLDFANDNDACGYLDKDNEVAKFMIIKMNQKHHEKFVWICQKLLKNYNALQNETK